MILSVMGALFVVVAIIVLVSIATRSEDPHPLRLSSGISAYNLPYKTMASLLTPSERSFFGVLSPIAEAEGLHIFAKVRLCDLFHVPAGTHHWRAYHNRIQQKHVDFVLCQRDEIDPVLAIELDDASHGRPDRQSRDVFVNAIFDGAGLPLLRVPVKSGYAPQDLQKLIHEALAPAASTAPPPAIPTPQVTWVAAALPIGASGIANKRCPTCGAALVVRTRRSNGEQFLGCQSYPNCRYTEPLRLPIELTSNENSK